MKKALSLLLILSFLFSSLSGTASTGTVVINPTSLRQYVLTQNNSITDAIFQLYKAKDEVAAARGSLLPSLNLGTILGATSGPSFLLQTVSFLLPFLVPSNWFNLKASEHQLDAQKSSYYILQLNAYASAYALYASILADLNQLDVLTKQYETLKHISDVLDEENDLNGNIDQEDLLDAQARTKMALLQVSQMTTVIDQEKASIRVALGFGLDETIEFDRTSSVQASSAETSDPTQLLKESLKIAPEITQLDALIESAKSEKWSATFGFVNSASLATAGSSQSSQTSAPLNKLIQTDKFQIGFNYFPTLALSQDDIDALENQRIDIQQKNGQVIETTLSALSEAKKQAVLAQDAEVGLQKVYDIESEKYGLGLTDLLHVLDAQTNVTQASTARAQAQAALDNQRITLHRLLLTGEFDHSLIRGCELTGTAQDEGGFWDWLKSIFHPQAGHVSLDEACKPKS